MAMSLVSTVTVGSGGAASIEFTGIAGTGKDLLVLLSGRGVEAATLTDYYLELNGVTAANYNSRLLYGSGSSAASTTSTGYINGAIRAGWVPSSNATASTFGNDLIYISNYTSTTNKSISTDSVTENNATVSNQNLTAGSFTSSSAITSVKLYVAGVNFAQHSTASLYIIS